MHVRQFPVRIAGLPAKEPVIIYGMGAPWGWGGGSFVVKYKKILSDDFENIQFQLLVLFLFIYLELQDDLIL